jgi:hypothetical protein
MPYSRRTGKRYAAGSQATFDGYPRVCSNPDCPYGGKVVMSHGIALWFEHVDGEAKSWHFACKPRKLSAT